MDLILVTGANGQLGQEIRRLAFEYIKFKFIFLTRDDLDISSTDAVHQKLMELKPAFCINCAAYTAVDKAETEIETAFSINAKGAENLAIAAKEVGTGFIHISTDYVFNGKGYKPYKEEDELEPINVYGATKLSGEKLVLAANPDSIIIRTSWVYSAFGNNFVKTMIRLMSSKPEINVVSDQKGSPTYAADLAKALFEIITITNWYPGIYHYSNEGIISWYEFALEIKNYIGSHCIIHPIPTEQYPTPAKRPVFSAMDKTKIQQAFHLSIPDWKKSLHECLDRLTV